MFWLKAVNDITARQTRTSLHDVIKVCSIGYLTTQIELVLPICKSWSVHRIIKYFMSGLLFSLRNIYHSTKAYFLTHPVHTMVNLSAVAIRTVVANFRRTHSPSCWLDLRVGGQRRSVWIHEVNRANSCSGSDPRRQHHKYRPGYYYYYWCPYNWATSKEYPSH